MKIYIALLITLTVLINAKAQYVPLAAYDTVHAPKAHSCYSNSLDFGDDSAIAYFFSGKLIKIIYNFESENHYQNETLDFSNNTTTYNFVKYIKLKAQIADTNSHVLQPQKMVYSVAATAIKLSKPVYNIKINNNSYKEELEIFNNTYLARRKNELLKRVDSFIKIKDKKVNLKWIKVDSLSKNGIDVYYTNSMLRGKPNIAYYATALLKNKNLNFNAISTNGKRLTPSQFYQAYNKPALIINCTFFNFKTNQNLNIVINNGNLKAYNIPSLSYKQKSGNDSIIAYYYPFRSAIGINKNRLADAAWVYTDTSMKKAIAFQKYPTALQTGNAILPNKQTLNKLAKPWLVNTAIGGGPMLLQNGIWHITANEERLFIGAVNVAHPRTAIGYTANGRLIILMVEGRNPLAGGATLLEEAEILKQLGCVEALNLDGGGSSCMLINGTPTIKVSDKEGQRAVPAVFVISTK